MESSNMIRSILGRTAVLVGTLTLSSLAHAQYGSGDGIGWDFGVDLIYQNATTIDFSGGTSANLNADWGLALNFGYHVNPHVEAQFGLDWTNIDYRANLALGTGGVTQAEGNYQSFTPRVNLIYNFLDQPLTPFVMAGIGYSFIDTNVPAGRPQTGCWWDPWYGYICSSVQPTKTEDGFAYQVGLGAKWDLGGASSVRLSAERHWMDLGGNAGTPAVYQIRLGYSMRFY
jgi:opacity protein-like surface antigen